MGSIDLKGNPYTGCNQPHIWVTDFGKLPDMGEAPRKSRSKGKISSVVPEEARAIRKVVSDNLNRLMESHPKLETIKMLHANCKSVSTGTIGRAKTGEVAIGIDTLALIAKTFGLDAWQMLVPNIEVTNPPVLVPMTPEERQLYESIKRNAVAYAEALREQGNTQPGDL